MHYIADFYVKGWPPGPKVTNVRVFLNVYPDRPLSIVRRLAWKAFRETVKKPRRFKMSECRVS